ncbi:MAG TPA: rhomboid family intramembrane serine protease [Terriglobales bacterium]|jgi:rhomboid protease GluP|nr:rhomboid family intramembrane serine protease [Terriglobales bacterium]
MSLRRAQCEQCGKEYTPPWFGGSRLCPECRKEAQGPRIRTMADVDAAASAGLSMTTVIVGLNVAVFIGMTLSGVSPTEPTGQQLVTWGANFGPLTLGPDPWRAFTYMFVHIGILHIACNMWAFWNLGKLGEGLFGRVVFAVLYVVCGLGAAVASLWWHPASVCAGASGAIFGVAGIVFSYLKLKHVPLPQQYVRRLLSSLGAFMLFNLLIGAAIPFIDNSAHIGGLVTGLVLGALLPRPAFRGEERSPFRYFAIPLLAALILLGGWVLQRRYSGPLALAAGAERAQADDYDAAIPYLERAARAFPNDARTHLMLGDAYSHKQRYPEAAREFARAVELDPDDAQARLLLGVTYHQLHRMDDAEVELQKAVALNPDDSEAHYDLGLLYFDQKKYGPAAAEFQKALDVDPQYEEARKSLADAQAAMQKQPKTPARQASPRK